MLIFRPILLFWRFTRKCLHALMFKKHIIFSHCIYSCSTSIHPLSEMLHFSACLFVCCLLSLVSSLRPEQAPPTNSKHRLCHNHLLIHYSLLTIYGVLYRGLCSELICKMKKHFQTLLGSFSMCC